MGEALRDLRRAGRVGVSAVLLIALSLAALGGFWLLSLNLGRAIGQWRDRVRVVVYLREEPPAAKVRRSPEAGSRRWAGSSGCATCPRHEALQLLKRSLGGQADVADQLPRNPLPASVEVTPDSDRATPEGTRELVRRLTALARGGGGAGRLPVGRGPGPVPAPVLVDRARGGGGARPGRDPHRHHRDDPGVAPATGRDGDHAALRGDRCRDPAAARLPGHGPGPGGGHRRPGRARGRVRAGRAPARALAPRHPRYRAGGVPVRAPDAPASWRAAPSSALSAASWPRGALTHDAGGHGHRGHPGGSRGASRGGPPAPARRGAGRQAAGSAGNTEAATERSARRRPRPSGGRRGSSPSSTRSTGAWATSAVRSRLWMAGSGAPRPISGSTSGTSRASTGGGPARRKRWRGAWRALYKLEAQGGVLPVLLSGRIPVSQAVQTPAPLDPGHGGRASQPRVSCDF